MHEVRGTATQTLIGHFHGTNVGEVSLLVFLKR